MCISISDDDNWKLAFYWFSIYFGLAFKKSSSMIYKFTSANFLYPIGCLLKTRILNIRIFNLVFYTIWTLGLTLLNWIFFSNLDPLWGVHLYMSFPVGRFQWTNSTLTSLPELLEKRNIFNTRRCVVFRFTFSFFISIN